MKWTVPEKCHQRVSSGLCTYPHMCVHTGRTGLRDSGVSAVGFLKGRRKGRMESGNVCGGGNAIMVILRLIITCECIDRGSVLGKATFARAGGPGRPVTCLLSPLLLFLCLLPLDWGHFSTLQQLLSRDTYPPFLVLSPSRPPKAGLTAGSLWGFLCLSYHGCKDHNFQRKVGNVKLYLRR